MELNSDHLKEHHKKLVIIYNLLDFKNKLIY